MTYTQIPMKLLAFEFEDLQLDPYKLDGVRALGPIARFLWTWWHERM